MMEHTGLCPRAPNLAGKAFSKLSTVKASGTGLDWPCGPFYPYRKRVDQVSVANFWGCCYQEGAFTLGSVDQPFSVGGCLTEEQ